MRFNWIVVLLILSGGLWAQKVEEQGFVGESYDEFIRGKKKQSYMWYSGAVIGGFGVLSLVIGSHFDGLAAVKRNEASALIESNDDSKKTLYVETYGDMEDLRDKRDIFWQVGLIGGAIGGGLMILDFALSQDVSIAPKVDGVQVAVRF
jgi:hypothetical protein